VGLAVDPTAAPTDSGIGGLQTMHGCFCGCASRNGTGAAMLTAAARELQTEFPGIKPRTLDNLIWRQERER
jgi:hypothetical protein